MPLNWKLYIWKWNKAIFRNDYLTIELGVLEYSFTKWVSGRLGKCRDIVFMQAANVAFLLAQLKAKRPKLWCCLRLSEHAINSPLKFQLLWFPRWTWSCSDSCEIFWTTSEQHRPICLSRKNRISAHVCEHLHVFLSVEVFRSQKKSSDGGFYNVKWSKFGCGQRKHFSFDSNPNFAVSCEKVRGWRKLSGTVAVCCMLHRPFTIILMTRIWKIQKSKNRSSVFWFPI